MLVEKYGWQFKKAYLHRPIKILYFLSPARTQKCLKETRNSSKIRPLEFEKKVIAQLRKMFCEIPMNTRATISVMLLC